MKKNQRIVAGIAAIIVGVGIIVAAVLVGNNQNANDPAADNPDRRICPMSETDGATTVIYSGVKDETALDTLRELCDVETQSSDYGEFVTYIGGKEAGTEYYWAFYVNDAYANEGAGTYKAKDGDRIKWVLIKLDAAY